MDITIQSLVQSPYMRAMAVVPTKSEELVHGIHDHLPPLVQTQVRIAPVRNPGKIGKWTFNIPRRGLWHRAQLVVRPRISNGELAAAVDARQTATASTFVEAVENVELYSKQRFIERLMPEAIVSEMLAHGPKLEQWYQFTYADVESDGKTFRNEEVSWPSIGSTAPVGGLATRNDSREKSRPHYVIPLPMASFTSIKKNFQTLFVETLSLVVTTKDFSYFATTGYDMELICDFHSFHPNVETVIRNANYKQMIPATLPWHDWIVFDHRINSAGDSSVNGKITYSLESDALISKLLVVPQNNVNVAGRGTIRTIATTQNFYIVVRSLSEVLFEGSVANLKASYDLTLDETDASRHPEIVLDASTAFYIPINFGLRGDNERFTGGLALSSITNPRIEVYASEAVYRGGAVTSNTSSSFPTAEFDFKILAKRHFFLRIDSDTGVITRSIES